MMRFASAAFVLFLSAAAAAPNPTPVDPAWPRDVNTIAGSAVDPPAPTIMAVNVEEIQRRVDEAGSSSRELLTTEVRNGTVTTVYTVTPSPSPSPPPYIDKGNQGPEGTEEQLDRCHVHVEQRGNCDNEWWAKVQIWDAAGNEILPLSEEKSLEGKGSAWESRLEDRLILSRDENDIKFQLGYRSEWSSKDSDKKKENWCDKGGFDPRSGPRRHAPPRGFGGDGICEEATRKMECYFRCTYQGHMPSAGW